jgi:hypothetical protein
MTIAEIRGKISQTGQNLSERMEDLLTSDIFGCMRYLPTQDALTPFLQTACSLHGNILTVPGNVLRVHWAFWPWLKSAGHIPCEPDVIIGLETEEDHVHLILIEAKYYSGLSSEEDERAEPNDQLARELDNLDALSCVGLGWVTHLRIVSRMLLFVTQDMGMPRKLLAQSLAEYQRKRNRQADIYWTSWRFLQPILEKSLTEEDSPQSIAVMEDMLGLLLRKGLTIFRGVDPITMRFDIPQFYAMPERVYAWPMIRAGIRVNFEYEVKENG